jgi:hypothetical protein
VLEASLGNMIILAGSILANVNQLESSMLANISILSGTMLANQPNKLVGLESTGYSW